MTIDKVVKPEKGKKASKCIKYLKYFLKFSAIIFGILSIGSLWFLSSDNNQNTRDIVNINDSTKSSELVQYCPDAPRYWGLSLYEWIKNGNFRTMDRVFHRLGYISVNGSNGDDWDVFWSEEYPYIHPDVDRSKLYDPLNKPIKLHQRINRFPGINFITAKSFMTSRNRNIKYVLPGFVFPRMINEFKAYLEENPNARFVEKALHNRGVRLVEKHEIVYDESEIFYQHFMEKPFLVDGRFMDFGVYGLISSINPLRLYRYDQEVHLRFCPEPYYPFDAKNLNKYVIANNRLDFTILPDRNTYFNDYGFSFKLSIEEYFREKGHNVTEFWRKIDEAIVQLILNNEQDFVREVRGTF